MPTNKEKSRRRNISSSSESNGQPVSLLNHTLTDESTSSELADDMVSLNITCNPSSLPCCNPKGCVLGPIQSSPISADVVRMQCSNDRCPFSTYMHAECFESFEEQILSCLRGMSRAKNWSEKQRRQNLWTKKGYDLVYRFCSCRCSKGTLKKDLNHVLPVPHSPSTTNTPTGPAFSTSMTTPTPPSVFSSSCSVSIAQPSDKSKKKRKKSTSFSEKSSLVSQATPIRQRSRSHRNSDSVSSDNGNNYMQPFAHRTDFSIFDQLLPRKMVNSYHIKMEDDGYAAGDDTRSLVLSCLAFHHKSSVSCVLCNTSMEVYDRFPLINGTFFLSPLQTVPTSLEVESKGDDPLYMSAVCLYCLSGLNKVYCTLCNTIWNGQCHQIGTMYTFDIFACSPCCSGAVQCKSCKRSLLETSKITLSFTQLSSLYDCTFCGTKDYHFIRPLSQFSVICKHTDLLQDQRLL